MRAVLALALALTPGVGRPAAAAPVVPDAGECQTVPQRSLVVLFATPVAATAIPQVATPTIPPTGPPADAATIDAVTATTYAVIACYNAGDYWSLVTLVSDDYLRRSFVDGTPTDPLAVELEPFVNAVRGCQQCEIAPREGEDRLAIAAITNPRLLNDGRIGIDLELASPSGANPQRLVAALIAVDDRWLVDEIIAVDGDGTPPS
jgi:hypothetical protein